MLCKCCQYRKLHLCDHPSVSSSCCLYKLHSLKCIDLGMLHWVIAHRMFDAYPGLLQIHCNKSRWPLIYAILGELYQRFMLCWNMTYGVTWLYLLVSDTMLLCRGWKTERSSRGSVEIGAEGLFPVQKVVHPLGKPASPNLYRGGVCHSSSTFTCYDQLTQVSAIL